jgi:hypothetical protein
MLGFHGIEHQLRKISDADWRDGLTRAFGELGCEIADEAIREALRESGGHTERTMMVARETHRIVQTSKTPTSASRGHVVAGADAARRHHRWRDVDGDE